MSHNEVPTAMRPSSRSSDLQRYMVKSGLDAMDI